MKNEKQEIDSLREKIEQLQLELKQKEIEFSREVAIEESLKTDNVHIKPYKPVFVGFGRHIFMMYVLEDKDGVQSTIPNVYLWTELRDEHQEWGYIPLDYETSRELWNKYKSMGLK